MDTKELIFNMYKDEVIISKKFRKGIEKKYNISSDDARNLYVKIINYQIKKYGSRLDTNEPAMTKEEARRIHLTSNTRRWQKKNRYWETIELYRKWDN